MTSVADLIGADGAAGQPQVLHTAARRLDQAGGEVARLRASLAAVEAAHWRGNARARFDTLRDRTVDEDLAPIDPHYDAAVSALRAYGHRLDEIQERARALARTMTSDEHKLEGHHRDQLVADGLVAAAVAAAAVTTLTPTAKAAALLALREAKQHQARVRAQTAATQRRLAQGRAVGHELRAELDLAAKGCAATLDGLRPPAAPRRLTPVEAAAGGAAAVAGAVAAIRKVRPGGNGPSPNGAADAAREQRLRTEWNATPVSRGASVAAWARDQLGKTHADAADAAKYGADDWGRTVYGEWSGDCIKFVQVAYDHGAAGGVLHGNAADVYRQYLAAGAIQHGVPPEGAIVFWPDVAHPYGHVAIADGAGGVYTTLGMDGANAGIAHLSAAECQTRYKAAAGWVLPA